MKKQLANGAGWTLIAEKCPFEGTWGLYVEGFGNSASLSCAVNEGETCNERGEAIPNKLAAQSMFERWDDQYDEWIEMLEGQ